MTNHYYKEFLSILHDEKQIGCENKKDDLMQE